MKRSHAAFAALFAFALLGSPAARAYLLTGGSWPSGTIPMVLQLDATKPATALPLTDGAATWNAMAAGIFSDWNAVINRTKFASVESTSTAAAFGDGVNNVLFATTVYGDPFDSRFLAITLFNRTVRRTESDVLVNKSGFNWNSYRGTIRSNPYDLRRVLLHEFGHVLGLDHPDEATPAQSVAAMMNSTVGNTQSLQPDDTAGAAFLYNTPFAKPILTRQPASATVNVAGSASFNVAVNGSTAFTADPFHGYAWFFAPAGSSTYEELFTVLDPTRLDFNLAQLGDAGRYYFAALTPDDTVKSDVVTLTVNPVSLSTTTQLANVATRGTAGAGANAMIVGFVITGAKPKQVLLRAVGPGLAAFGVTGTLADPILTLKNSAGADVATNNDWEQQTGTTAAAVSGTAARVGAFALAPRSKDAVILATLPPGGYTALVSSPDSSTGAVIVEAYDADSPLDPAVKLLNLSTRGYVGTGANIIIAGFVVTGPGPRTYLVRAVGPTLLNSPFGLSGALLDPYLKIYRSDGTLVRENDDWDSPAAAQPSLRAAAASVGAFALLEKRGTSPATGLDSAMLITLPPGGYTAQMSGLDGVTGIGLVEVYEIP